MANKRLNATITIGGAITGTLKSALGTTRDKVNEIGQAITNLKNRQRELNGVVSEQERLGRSGNALRVQYANQELGQINQQIEALRRKQRIEKQIGDTQASIAEARSKYRAGMFDKAAAAFAIGGLMRAPLKSFEELDAALNNMQVAMTNSTGKLPVQFEAIKKQTIELGNLLPGTTADFVNLATALKEQGMPMEAIAGGALKSAAHLAVVMKMVPEQAGEMVAKLREAFQLGETEFANMADYTQRARFGFGLKPDDLLLGAKYYGGKLNALGLTGAENVRRIYAIQGMAAQQGMDGSTFGTNFSMMLTRVGLMTERLHKNSKEMKAVNAELDKAGIHMQFFDKAGNFAGVENMVQQLDKLKALSMEKRLQVLTRIFGEEGGRVADLIARNGVQGYQKALQAMDAEATLAQRIAIATSSFRNQIEAFTGTFTNFLAAVGKPLGEMFAPVLGTLNEIVGGPMMGIIERNETAVKVVGTLLTASAGVLALGAGINAIGFLTTFAMGGLLTMAPLLTGIGTAAMWVAGTAVPFLVSGIWSVTAALVANPIGAAIAAIAVSALLIYKYWEPIKAFAQSMWGAVSGFVTENWDTIKRVLSWTPIGLIVANWEPIRKFFVGLFQDIKSTAMGAIEWVLEKIAAVGRLWDKTKAVFSSDKPGQAPAQGQQPANPVAAALPARPGAPMALTGGQPDLWVSRPLPAVPAMATARTSASPVVTDNRQFSFVVNAAPGQDPRAVASEVQRVMRDDAGVRRRSIMFDQAMGY